MSSSKVAIVTGASRGIGRSVAAHLGALGFSVAINYNSNADAAKEAAALVEEAGGKAHIVQANIGNLSDHRRLVDETLSVFGSITMLVNNAGVAPKVRADLLEMSEDSYDYVVDTNLKGPFFLTQLVANHMAKAVTDEPRCIVNVGSISAYTASVNRGEYCIAKAGIGMLTQLFAARLAEFGVNVYEIRPGIIQTDMTSGVQEKYNKLINDDGLTPIKRWGQPDDIGKAVAAIARGDFPFSTGEVFNVDGGFHMKTL